MINATKFKQWSVAKMNKQFISIVSMATCLFLSACHSTSTNIKFQTQCKNPRPEMCTMDYKPVCGVLSDDATKTFSNACSACSDKAVLGYNNGECSK